MSISNECALEILGLPSFATRENIIAKYKLLALEFFPEVHNNSEHAIQEFSNISEAVAKLIFYKRETRYPDLEILPNMYSLFQAIFFRTKEDQEDLETESDEYDSDGSASVVSNLAAMMEKGIKDIQAAEGNADALIREEEQEKTLAEKRRAKKKRRKERKKLEKLDAVNNPGRATKTKSGEDETTSMKGDERNSDAEEDIDPNSAFVSVIARKHKKNGIKHTAGSKNCSPGSDNYAFQNAELKEDPQSIVNRSMELALRGSELAKNGYFAEAAKLFTEAIGLHSSDHRYYGNRSYCYDRLKKYDRALKDAEKSLLLFPNWSKGHFRKGRALLGLKKYELAEKSFEETLKLDKDCDDVAPELLQTKIRQIIEKGFSMPEAEQALSMYPTVHEALTFLRFSRVPGMAQAQQTYEAEIYISDDEGEVWNSVTRPHAAAAATQAYDIKEDPNNPEKHNSLWVGNVQPSVTEKKIATLFSKYGDILSVKVMPEKFCAFINFKSKLSPGPAMKALQGFEIAGYHLYIRFPNTPGDTKKTVKRKL